MPKALANRLLHIEIEGSFNSWLGWAMKSGVNQKVIGFLSFRTDKLFGFDAKSDDLAFATPRSWEMVSNILHGMGTDTKKVHPLISGLVGSGVAVEFRTFCSIYRDLPSIEDIFNGRMPPAPHSTDALYALTSSMTAYAREHRTDLTKLANSIRYAERLPADFSALLLRDYMYLEKDFKNVLMRIPEFSHWLQSKGKLLNGVV